MRNSLDFLYKRIFKRGYTKDIDIVRYPISIEGTTQFVAELNESKKYSNINL